MQTQGLNFLFLSLFDLQSSIVVFFVERLRCQINVSFLKFIVFSIIRDLGAIRKVLSKLSVNGSTLKTRMTPEFLQLIADYDKYEELVVDLVDKLESLMQPDSSIIEVTFITARL